MSVDYVKIDRTLPNTPVLIMDRPERVNALSPTTIAAYSDALSELETDPDVAAIVLTGAGKGFCSGADMSGETDPLMHSMERGQVGSKLWKQEQYANLVVRIYESPKPIIAAVHGGAIGGGLAIAIACDARVATRSARFGAYFVRRGLTSCDMGVSYLLPRIVGLGVASELMLTGRSFDGEEAYMLRLVNRLASEGQHVAASLELAQEIARNSEYSRWGTKKGLRANVDAPSLRHAIELENRVQVLGAFTGGFIEAMAAFKENREPRWPAM